MKKMLVFLLAFVMLLPLVAVDAFAADLPVVEITAADQIGEDGTVTVTVSVSGAQGIRGIAVVPTYDGAVFELVSGSWEVSGVLADFSVEKGDGVIAFENATDVNAVIFTYILKLRPNTREQEQEVGCEVVLSGADSENLTLWGSDMVHVPGSLCHGDANGDGHIDTTDAKLIMQYDLGLIGADAVNLAVMDVNGDGAVDTTDAKLVMQYDLGLIDQFPLGQ